MFNNRKIKVVCGPMESGKSDWLIRKITKCLIAEDNVMIYKPSTDTRDGCAIVSRNGGKIVSNVKIVSNSIEMSSDIKKNISENNKKPVVFIDEAQFFDFNIINVVKNLAWNEGIPVVISGLEKDYMGRPFGPMPDLLAIADDIKKLSAVCKKCKNNSAHFTYKKVLNGKQEEVGGEELYEARCVKCWRERD